MPRLNKPGLRPLLACCVGAAALISATASPAHAEWRKAESERFVVYSEGSEAALRRFVQRLEVFDRVLNIRLTGSMGEAPPRKLPIYLVGSRADLVKVSPGIGEGIVGYYVPSDEDIFALAIRDADDDTLLHEYAHHFMFQNAAYPYPAWFVEGFAEYYMTIEFKSDRVLTGRANTNRAYWLQNGRWLDMRALLSTRPGAQAKGSETYYPLAWLLTHWFWGNPERQVQLTAYLRDVAAGGDPVEAMQRATGLDMPQLTRELRRYMNGQIPYQGMTIDTTAAPVSITALPPSADALLILGQRVKLMNKDDDDAAAVLAQVRRAAARYAGDTLATLVQAEAEFKVGDPAVADTLITGLLQREPENVEALQLLAEARLKASRGADDPDEADRLRTEASRLLARAFQADDANYRTFMLLAQTRSGRPGYPNDNDIATLQLAQALAPQLPDTVLSLGSILMQTGKADEAILLLEPLANSPHGGGGAAAARSMINSIKGVAPDDDAEDDSADPEPETEAPDAG